MTYILLNQVEHLNLIVYNFLHSAHDFSRGKVNVIKV
jgi:hypothetical protein